MSIDVSRTQALALLNASYERCSKLPVTDCIMKDSIDFIMGAKNCLTYRYIMFTALIAKATNGDVDILSLQSGDSSAGAYDARSLCNKVVFPFQKTMLGDIIDGSNDDPLVNKPARFPRLSMSNAVAGGNPKQALTMLCRDLPKVDTSPKALECVDYLVSSLIDKQKLRDETRKELEEKIADLDAFAVYSFLSELLNQGFGGAALVLVASALYHVQYYEEGFQVSAHPVNQAGTSSRQFSDLDLLLNGEAYMGTELKDKPFKSADVEHAAATALKAGAKGLLFVAGRQSFLDAPSTYFSKARAKYAAKGIAVGVTRIDDLMDTVFTAHANSPRMVEVYDVVRRTAEEIGALEAQVWIYARMRAEE